MPRNTHEIQVHSIDVKGDLSGSLRSIRVEVYATMFACNSAYFLDRLDDPCLVVDGHNRNQGGVGSDCVLKLFKRNDAITLHGEVSNVKALLLQFTT